MLAIMVECEKLYCDNMGDAPIGTKRQFNILENAMFKRRYGFMNYRNFPHYTALLVNEWNKSQPNNWKYTIIK